MSATEKALQAKLKLAETKQKNNVVLDLLFDKLNVKNDAALAKAMKVMPPVVSKLRHGHLPFGDTYIIMAHELTGWSIREIKDWLGKPSLASLKSAL